MAFPLTAPNLRRITVDGLLYRWRLKAWTPDSHLFVYGLNSAVRLRVTLHDWHDHRCYYPFLMPNEPGIIGPSFVRGAIKFALENGWCSEERGAPFEVSWNGKEFSPANETAP